MDGFLPWRAIEGSLHRAIRRIKSSEPFHAIFEEASDIAARHPLADTAAKGQEDTP
jgi:hypothetical protein